MKRLAALDYGKKRIGLSLTDPSKTIAQPQKCLEAGSSLEETAKIIVKALSIYDLDGIVLGLPLHMSGKESPLSLEVRQLAEELKKLLPISYYFWDERLTTAEVERQLKEAKMSRKKRVPILDSLCATLFLQNFLCTYQPSPL